MASGPPRGSMSQERVFYTKEWTKEIDGFFIHALTQQTMEGYIVFNGIPNCSSLLYCQALINNQFGKSFEYDFFVDRFNKLYKRFTVFNWIIKQPGVIHYPLDHAIDCDETAWNAICRYDALGLAYMRKGEAEFDNLQYIFTAGHESEDEADEHQVIENSGDPDAITTPTDEANDGQNNAFSYELAWYTSPTRSAASDSSYSSLSGASSNVKKSFGKRHSNKHPPVPPLPSGSGPSSVASSSPFKKV